MVNAIRSPLHRLARVHPDIKRIAGLAAAFALNAALLMLLLVPMGAPPTLSLPSAPTVIEWITHPQPKPKPPVTVPVTRPHAQPRNVPVTQPRAEIQPADNPVIVDRGSEPVIEQQVEDTGPSTMAETGPVPGVRLEYADAPAPSYPRDALREGVEGTVMLQVLVDVDGRPLQVDVQRSSGDRRLDAAARRQVLQHWRFRPAMQDGRPVQAIGLVPIAFNLRG
jgi:periplasmic protein TonB